MRTARRYGCVCPPVHLLLQRSLLPLPLPSLPVHLYTMQLVHLLCVRVWWGGIELCMCVSVCLLLSRVGVAASLTDYNPGADNKATVRTYTSSNTTYVWYDTVGLSMYPSPSAAASSSAAWQLAAGQRHSFLLALDSAGLSRYVKPLPLTA